MSIFAYVLNGKVWYEVNDEKGNLILKTTDQRKAYELVEVII